jgi:serine/threonine protein kinase
VPEISPGTTLGRYRIISKIGVGGMGEVYRAQDVELDRPVALKFLPGEVAAHQSRLKRFIQEAKAASALNHPNIITVHEIGRVDDITFLATEFVDGITLRHHMHQRLKLVEILDIAIQVASALVAAHAAGIIHRDIKPDNIMVRRDGIVKVLDFGLAKLTDKQDSSISGPEATTVALLNTEPGAILGTVAYMSPEQAAGREVDARSDIWSLGVVLYEMLTSHAPFAGASKSHIIVAITDSEPTPVTQFVPDVPQPLEWIIAETLTKDREERCQTAKELLGKLRRLKQRVESGNLSASMSDFNRSTPPQSLTPETNSNLLSLPAKQTVHDTVRSTSPSGELALTRELSGVEFVAAGIKRYRKAVIGLATLGLILVAASGFGLYKLWTVPKQFGPAKLTALTTGGKLNGEDINGQVSISPDGKYVVSSANDSKQQASLWLRQVSTSSLVRIVPPENGGYLSTTFSTDGELVYYVATLERNKFVPTLYRIPVLGGTPAKVLDRVFSPIAFSKDGKQFAFVRRNQEDMALMVADTDGGGEPRTIATLKAPNGFSTFGPSWSPDGKRIACGMLNGTGPEYSTVVEVPVAGGDPVSIGSERWARVGRVVWMADGSGLIMTAQPELSSAGTQIWFLPYPSGQARRITNDLNGYGEVSLGMTADGSTIATIQIIHASSIWIAAPNDDETRARLILKTSLPDTMAWTPNGRLVYASRTGENWDIWISNRDGSETKQLTTDPFIDQQPSVCSDGRYIVFQSNRSGSRNIWRIDADGSNAKQLTEGSHDDASPVCSADGRFVVFASLRSGKSTIWKVGIDGGSPVQLTDHVAQLPSISPDGKSIAYFYQDEQANGQPTLGFIPFEGGAQTNSIDLPRSVQPLAFSWMPDGRAIAYLNNASGVLNVWSQPIDRGAPTQLTNFKSEFVTSFAISGDGKIAVYRYSGTRDIVLIKDFR